MDLHSKSEVKTRIQSACVRRSMQEHRHNFVPYIISSSNFNRDEQNLYLPRANPLISSTLVLLLMLIHEALDLPPSLIYTPLKVMASFLRVRVDVLAAVRLVAAQQVVGEGVDTVADVLAGLLGRCVSDNKRSKNDGYYEREFADEYTME